MFLSGACVDICVCASFSLISFILDQTGKERGSKLGIDMSKQEVALAVGTAVGTGRYADTEDDGLFPEQFLTGQATPQQNSRHSPPLLYKKSYKNTLTLHSRMEFVNL